jgi:CO/xanthine dehydrogenase Mo-binding subunit/aerobic-type carbon monoxide dehydrogenase small subunit (CoxS/CutS family)
MNERLHVRLVVNGVQREAYVEPRRSLADLLREDLGLTGTHLGCEQGVCGACTVLVDGRSVRSCLLLAVQAGGRTVETVESLAGVAGGLHPIQDAFSACHGLQCGFCTPGFLMRTKELLDENPHPSDDEIRAAIGGNLCRCTGYHSIVESVREAARRLGPARSGSDEPHGSATPRWIGRDAPRLEDPALLSGRGVYVADVNPPGLLHAAVLRSPHPHARIVSVDVSGALDVPGVAAVVTGEQLSSLVGPVAWFCDEPVVQDALAVGRVRYEGEAVAAVAAESRAAAEDACDRIRVEYEPLAALTDPFAALEEGAPLLHETLESNLVWSRSLTFGDVDGDFARADRVIRRRLRWHRMSAQAIETAGVVASWEPATKSMTVWSNALAANMMAGAFGEMLRVETNRLRLVPCLSGGNFGSKILLGKNVCVAGALTKLTGRPVKFVDDRLEHVQAADNTASDRFYDAELAVTDEGEFLSLKIDVLEDYGAYFNLGPVHHANALATPTGPYRIGSLRYEVRGVLTTKTGQTGMRGAGSEPANFVLERLVDAAAAELGIDRVELRRRNLIHRDEFPYRTPQGNEYDSGDYERVLDLAVTDGRVQEWLAEQARAREQGRHIGIGIASCQERTTFTGTNFWLLYDEPKVPATAAPETVHVAIDAAGNTFVTLAGAFVGTSPCTIAAQVLAEELGIDPGTIAFEFADSQAGLIGPGPGGSRTTVMLSGAVAGAAAQLREKILEIAAHRLEADSSDLVLEDGSVVVKGSPNVSLSIAEIAAMANLFALDLPEGMASGLHATYRYDHPYSTKPNADRTDLGVFYGIVGHGCHVAVVEVDPETGVVTPLSYLAVNDSGTVMNPTLLEGQIRGGVVQGIGAALSEQYVYGDAGELLTRDYTEYLLPSVDVVPPEFRVVHNETPSPFTTYGVKGGGEGGRMMAPAAIASAVEDALGPFGVSIDEAPITPSRIVELVEEARRSGADSAARPAPVLPDRGGAF